MKSLVQGECGQPNALVNFSKIIVHGSSRSLPATQSLNPPVSSTFAEQLAEEYLNDWTHSTPTPTTFDLADLKEQLSNIPDRPSIESPGVITEAWAGEFLESQSSTFSSKLASQWVDETVAKSTDKLASEWSEEFNTSLNSDSLETIWEGTTASPSAWPSDFLSQFDNSLKEAKIKEKKWVTEFLKKGLSDAAADSSIYGSLEVEEDPVSEIADSLGVYSSIYRNYNFNKNNSFLNEGEPVQIAHQFMQSGQLSKAILCLEAALQKNSNDAGTWYLLGLCQAENEDDVRAICALNRSIELDPSNGDAYLALAVSLTNESLEKAALAQLGIWIHSHPVYSGFLPVSSGISSDKMSTENGFNKVEEMFLEAAQHQLPGGDASLQNAIGILYNIKNDYARASDALKTAVSIQSNDPRLWNRLGATLSNSGRPAEAVGAYRQALSLFPNYVRAKYNLGIACMRMKCCRDAITHFVGALELQQNTGTLNSSTIWSTLRSAVMSLYPQNAPELLETIYARDLQPSEDIKTQDVVKETDFVNDSTGSDKQTLDDRFGVRSMNNRQRVAGPIDVKYNVVPRPIADEHSGRRSLLIMNFREQKSMFRYIPDPEIRESQLQKAVASTKIPHSLSTTKPNRMNQEELSENLSVSDSGLKKSKTVKNVEQGSLQKKIEKEISKIGHEKNDNERILQKQVINSSVSLEPINSVSTQDGGRSVETAASSNSHSVEPQKFPEENNHLEETFKELGIGIQNNTEGVISNSLKDLNVNVKVKDEKVIVESEMESSEVALPDSDKSNVKPPTPLASNSKGSSYEAIKGEVEESFLSNLSLTATCLHGSCNHVFARCSKSKDSSLRVMRPQDDAVIAVPPRHRRKPKDLPSA